MVIVRGTRKFLQRVGPPTAASSARSSTMLGDWFATVLFWRPQLVLFVNATTLLPVFTPLAPAATVLDRFPCALATILQAHGVTSDIIDHEVTEARDTRLAKTNNRSILGVMNEFVHLTNRWRDDLHDANDVTWLSLQLAQVPCSPLYDRHISPDRELVAILRS